MPVRSRSPRIARRIITTGVVLAVALGALGVTPAGAATAGTASAAAGEPPVAHIVGGRPVRAGELTSLAALLYQGISKPQDRFFCSATVIDATHVLTAGHCVDPFAYGPVEVQVGSRDLGGKGAQLVRAQSITIDATYATGTTYSRDLAVVTLAAPVDVPAVALAGPSDTSRYAPGAAASVAGWGITRRGFMGIGAVPKRAKTTNQTVQADATCGDLWPGNFIAATDVCAGDRRTGVCNGDSGGPLYATDPDRGLVQIAVTSRAAGCAVGYPGVFTDVAAMRGWIDANMSRQCATRFRTYERIYAC